MQPEKRLSRRETIRAVGASVKFAISSSPLLLFFVLIEEIISRLVPFVNAFILAKLINTLPEVVNNPFAQAQAIRYVILLAGVTIIPTIINTIGGVYRRKKHVELSIAVKKRLHEAFAFLPYEMYEDKRIIDGFDRANRFADSLASFVLYRLRNIFGSIFAVIVAAIAFWSFSPWLTLIIFCLTIPTIWFELRMQGLRERQWRKNTLNYRKSYVHEDMVKPRMIKETRLLDLANYAIEKSLHFKLSAEMSQLKIDQKSEKYRIGGLVVSSAIEVIVLINALQKIVAGKLPIGQFVYVQQIASQYIGALRELSWLVQDLDELLFGITDFNDIVNSKPEETGEAVVNPRGDIVVSEVSFTYPQAETPALSSVSMNIRAGQTIAIVGENGAGKTTLIKLLMKLYNPTEGTITVGGQLLGDVGGQKWHRHIGALFQDFQTFYDFTLRQNVWFGDIKKSVDSEELTDALKAADAWSFANKLPKGMDTFLGKYMDEENGTDISGGQAQRLAIARILFRNPDLLILDEPTSAVDAKAEYKIFQAILKARAGRSTILISHRFSTVRKASYIYVLENGRVKEKGTHEELMKNKSLYHEMFSKQAEGYR